MSEELREEPTVWLDGAWIPSSAVRLNASDRGLTVGLGVFETLCGYEGVPFDFEKHYLRLQQGADKLALKTLSSEVVFQALLECAKKNQLTQGRSRLRITVLDTEGETKTLVTASKIPERAAFSQCIFSSYRVHSQNPLAGVKSTSYAMHLLALREAEQQGADEAILRNEQGHLCEGTTSNLFLVQNGVLRTPSLESGCLPGVVRDTVLEIAQERGLPVEECDLTEEDVVQAEEAFLTSSLREVQPVERIGDYVLPTVRSEFVASIQQIYQNLYESY